ncbi:MAG: hypothetical protein WA655_08520 [Candidatus Korobacteraceae bacterium]
MPALADRILCTMRVPFALAVLVVASFGTAQQPATPSAPPADAASVKFDFGWPQGMPWQKYSIEVHSDGKSHFEGDPNPEDTRDADTVRQDFTMSAANLQKIFELSRKLNYFRGELDSHLKHIAQTGKKTLEYRSPQIQGSATYNWSQNADVQELTRLFMGIAMTVDYGQKLAFQYRFDKLGMDQRLKELVSLQDDHGAEEIEIIAPILHKIADDPSMMNISRQSALHLLHTMNGDGSVAQNPASQ